MPYLELGTKTRLKDNYKGAVEPGELNYLITLMLIEGWKVAPKYSTLHKMYKDFVLNPEKNNALSLLYSELSDKVNRSDMFTAAALAFHEFYRRIGAIYENTKIITNGDVYLDIAKPLYEQLNELTKQVQKTQLIIPK